MQPKTCISVIALLVAAGCGPGTAQDNGRAQQGLSSASQIADLAVLRPPLNPEMALVSGDVSFRDGYTSRGESVHYAEVDGWAVVEGDMIIGTVEEVVARTQAVQTGGGAGVGGIRPAGASMVGSLYRSRWPGAVVPYTIDSTLPDSSWVSAAINAWQEKTRVRFVLRTASNAAQYPNYITFQRKVEGCFSSTGWVSGQGIVNLEPRCSTGITIHEIGHVLGLYHEQSRRDRDSFVRILWDNIEAGKSSQFSQYNTQYGADEFAYDYGSIMHYPADAFSQNGLLPTIEALGGQSIGQRSALSAEDAATVNRMYSIDDSETFILQTYLDVLRREADPSGYSFWINSLQNCNGAPACLASNRAILAADMLKSPENRLQDPDLDPTSPGYNAAFITHCYTNFLRRQPDPAGYSWWLNVLNSSGDYNDVVSGFITSSEYRARFGS